MSATVHPLDQSNLNAIHDRKKSFTVPLEVSRRVYTQEKFDEESWEPRERRPRFWGGAGEARADQNGVARRRIQYAMNFFKTD
jgi:hypothetical protein